MDNMDKIKKMYGSRGDENTLQALRLLNEIVNRKVDYTKTYMRDSLITVFFEPEGNRVKISLKLYRNEDIDSKLKNNGLPLVKLSERTKVIPSVSYEARKGLKNISSYVLTFRLEDVQKHTEMLKELFKEARLNS